MNERSLADLTDDDLLRRRLMGDDAALEVLVRRHGDIVRGACRRILGSRAEVEDAAQAVFIVLARRADAALAAPSFVAWLRVVATRCALRARSRGEPQTTMHPSVNHDPQRMLEEAEVRTLVAEELALLPAQMRDIFQLCDIDGVAQRLVAKRLSIPEGSIARLRANARHRLKIALRRRGVNGAAMLSAIGFASAFETTAAAAATTGGTMSATIFSIISVPVIATLALGPGDAGGAGRDNNQPVPVVVKAAEDAAFIVLSDGNLWQRSWQEKEKTWAWIFHGRPDQRTPLATSTVALMKSNKIFVVDADGMLWEHLRSQNTWTWTMHGAPPNTRLLSVSGTGIEDSKVFALAANGHCIERWWDGKDWQWRDHGAPAGTTMSEAAPAKVGQMTFDDGIGAGIAPARVPQMQFDDGIGSGISPVVWPKASEYSRGAAQSPAVPVPPERE